jgi:hypothetical protein
VLSYWRQGVAIATRHFGHLSNVCTLRICGAGIDLPDCDLSPPTDDHSKLRFNPEDCGIKLDVQASSFLGFDVSLIAVDSVGSQFGRKCH